MSGRAQTAGAVLAVAGLAITSCDTERRAIDRSDLPDVPDEAAAEVTYDVGDESFIVEQSVDGVGTTIDDVDLAVSTDDLVLVRVVEGAARLTVDFEADLDDDGFDTDLDLGELLPGETTLVTFDVAGVHEVRVGSDGPRLVVVSFEAAEPSN